MKKRWILNLIMLAVVAGLVSFLYLRPKPEVAKDNTYEVSAYKLAEFNEIKVEFPAKAAVTFEKVNGFWNLTAPYKTRADQASVQRILAVIAAGLGELPMKHSKATFEKISAQVAAQNSASTPVADVPGAD